jgi:hypothetical protein
VASSPPEWRLSTTVTGQHADPGMTGIVAVGPDDAWALGVTFPLHGAARTQRQIGTVVLHWTGVAWQDMPLPAKVARAWGGSTPLPIWTGASSASNIWAFNGEGNDYLHWDGSSWATGSVARASGSLQMNADAVLSPTDVWVLGAVYVGLASTGDGFAPAAARFDGRAWTTMRLPGSGAVTAASALAPDDIVAVLGGSLSAPGPAQPAVLSWNGTRWIAMPVQPHLPHGASLTSVLALSGTDIWIGGSAPDRSRGTREYLAHWNGRTWSATGLPAPASAVRFGVADLIPAGHGTIWALAQNVGAPAVRLWYYDGASWSLVRPRVPAGRWIALAAVPHSGAAWAVIAGRGGRPVPQYIARTVPAPR